MPAEQQGAYAVARFVCYAGYPYPDKYFEPLDAAQIQRLYDFFVKEAVPCLESFGLTPDDPPSAQVFAETYETPHMWLPFKALGAVTDQDRYFEVSAACPQYPDDLWG